MKKVISLLLLFTVIFMVSCGQKPLPKENITIYHATDMHYLSQQLTENSPAFVEMLQSGDGKMVHCIEYITEAFVAEVIENRPDYVVISGDITFNGEKLSHLDFAKKLRKIEENGIQVLVIPGNHDVDYPFCFGYGQTHTYSAERMMDRDFETVYADFGLQQAYSRDKSSFSYMYRLSDKITLIAIDTNRGGGNGVVAQETISWLEKELKKADKDTIFISVTHQNLLSHFGDEMFSNSYSILNNQPLIKLFEQYNVKLNLSGHIHTQHIYSENGITDIATESMAVLPCNYGVVNIDADKIFYSTQAVNIEKWANENNITDINICDFNNYSREFYMNSQSLLCMNALEDYTYPQEEKKLLADFFAELNVYYFSGTVDEYYDYLKETEGYKKWLEKGKDLWHYQYIMARMEEGRSGVSHNSCTIALN